MKNFSKRMTTLLSKVEERSYSPIEAIKLVKENANAKFDESRITEIEKEVKHDVIAFLTSVNEFVGDSGRYIHVGMTSSDVLDTGLSLQLIDSCELL